MGVRTFIGIALPLLVRQALGAAQHAMRETSPAWRNEKWVAEENLHVTLKFLGSLPTELVVEASDALTNAAAILPPFQLRVGEIVAVPRTRSATMLWGRLEQGMDAAVELAHELDAALAAVGFPAETRPFKPHITLVRARGARRVTFETLDAGNHVIFTTNDRAKRMSVCGVTLFSSTLTPHGPVYEKRAFAPFAE
ncbi:MAG: RNA 2',3'-cyclic phosphodiesterase [Coriobacteriia bacterium]|nr:RNA 2',3'-cyclic phosphodiesterase [Coriobacteriia bacterium]